MKTKRKFCIQALRRYWPHTCDAIFQLPVPEQTPPVKEILPPQMIEVLLPEWAYDIGVNGKLFIPAWTITQGQSPVWQRTDWVAAMFWYLNGIAEQTHERLYGTVHSYSFRLKGWDPRLWERAWVNRIALFLRRWTARMIKQEEDTLFGPLPQPEIILTHDIDAIQKTLAIRFKQSAFHGLNAMKKYVQGKTDKAREKARQGARFLFSHDDYWCFDQITALEEKYGIRSYFHAYGGTSGWKRTPKRVLIDPSYDVLHPRLRQYLRELYQGGWTIGLHQSYNTWANAELMKKEKMHVEHALDAPVITCRQHWLRFSWEHTWQAQQQAGFELDTTLGFNDRSGFRNGAALRFHPWDAKIDKPMRLSAVPMILMDSHLYDYDDLEEDEVYQHIDFWLDEIKAVRGVGSVIWHQRVMSEDYGWSSGYEYLLSKIRT